MKDDRTAPRLQQLQVQESLTKWTARLGGKDFTSEVLDGDGEVLAFELSQAQANLIAAAPELLEATMGLIWLHNNRHNHAEKDFLVFLDAAAVDAYEAIAKVKGVET